MTIQKKSCRLSARAILCLIMALAVVLPSAAGDAKSVYAEVKDSVVAVYDGKEEADVGSGVIVGEGIVVTNFHVIEDIGESDLQIWKAADEQATDWYYVEAVVAWCEEKQDLCLLYAPDVLDTPDAKIATIGEAGALSIGGDVYAFGNPAGYEFSLSRGIVSKLNYDLGRFFPEYDFKNIHAPIVHTDADILGGSSGGGLFNEDGELVGITTFTVGDKDADTPNTELTFAMPVELVVDLLAAGSLNADKEHVAAIADALRYHASVGNVQAQFDLGGMYADIAERDDVSHYPLTDGERWLIGNAESASPDDLFKGLMAVKALEWYKHAAVQGHARAQYILASAYDGGVGADEGDKTEAVKWYRKAAENDEYFTAPLSAKRLGELLESGEGGVERNAEESAEFFQYAADEFHWWATDGADSDAQYHLGELFRDGKGVEQDACVAYIWFFVAAENDNEDAAAERDKMREKCGDDDIREKAEAFLKELNSEE